jgi:hypothetical protein
VGRLHHFDPSADDGSGHSWSYGIEGGFQALRRQGYTSPLMAEIEADFARLKTK